MITIGSGVTIGPGITIGAGVALPPGEAIVSSVINYSYSAYNLSSLIYVGPDSSSRPVFLFPYRDTNNYLKAVLYRINTDGTITEGAEQDSGSAVQIGRQIQGMSEYEGANSFGQGTPNNYLSICYWVDGAPKDYYVRALLADPSALTCTWGAAVACSMPAAEEEAVAAFVGNSCWIAGGRVTSNTSYRRFSRSGTTLTIQGTVLDGSYIQIDDGLLGFLNNGSTQYRAGAFNTLGGADGTAINAIEMNGSNYLVEDYTTFPDTRINIGCNLNNTNKYLGVMYDTTLVAGRVVAVDITWNPSSAASLTLGTAVTIPGYNPAAVGAGFYPASGFTTDTASIITTLPTTISYTPATVSGTAVTLNSSVLLLDGLSNIYYQTSGSSATIGAATYLSGITVRSSGAPYIWGSKLS